MRESSEIRRDAKTPDSPRASVRDESRTHASKRHHGDVTRIYLGEIGRAKLLSAQEEIELGKKIQKGCLVSRQRESPRI